MKPIQYFMVFRSNGLSVIHFYADWSEPCQHMNNILADLVLEDEFRVTFYDNICTNKTSKISLNISEH